MGGEDRLLLYSLLLYSSTLLIDLSVKFREAKDDVVDHAGAVAALGYAIDDERDDQLVAAGCGHVA